ncbi:MAG: DnaJ domain-containing protein [Chloroflexi bacterium]|nr:DnaJ domain-containing protein [Chloroflexota bacterium]
MRPGEERTLYAVLGLRNDAAGIDLRRAYRRLARQWHPDVCREPDAAEQFRAVQRAYEILSDPAQRARYDAGIALAATVRANDLQERANRPPAYGYRPPLRCGYLIAVGQEAVGRFAVASINLWEDITDRHGRVLVTSWPMGASAPVEEWL